MVFVSLVAMYPGLCQRISMKITEQNESTDLKQLTRTLLLAHSTAKLEAMCRTAKSLDQTGDVT